MVYNRINTVNFVYASLSVLKCGNGALNPVKSCT